MARILRLFSFLRDPRYFQIVFLSGFLLFGILELNWKVDGLKYLVILSSVCLSQWAAIRILRLPSNAMLSAVITGLGLCLLLQSHAYWAMAFAAVMAIASKFLIQYRGKHIFNPANFGIIASILLTEQTWISPGQWGSALILLIFFGAAGLMILFRISRLETGLTFFFTYFLLLTFWNVFYLGWEFEVVLHKITNGTVLLFSFFMITDPMTIPNDKRARIIWSAAVAVVSFIAVVKFQVYTAPIWVLFFFTPLTVFFDRLIPALKYHWKEGKSPVLSNLRLQPNKDPYEQIKLN